MASERSRGSIHVGGITNADELFTQPSDCGSLAAAPDVTMQDTKIPGTSTTWFFSSIIYHA